MGRANVCLLGFDSSSQSLSDQIIGSSDNRNLSIFALPNVLFVCLASFCALLISFNIARIFQLCPTVKYIYKVCVCANTCALCTWISEDNLEELVLPSTI